MVALVVILTIILFVTADYGVRILLANAGESKKRREREQALAVGLTLTFSNDTPTLRRVEVKEPKAAILAVDDEDVVLDSLRRILVAAGYSVDTVKTGPEALTLSRSCPYDFVFTDLKMPDMDGVEVVKAVKHIAPETDVVVVTGYASVESAVATMQMGALDYVQKPFTENELAEQVAKLVIRRQERHQRSQKPHVHLVTPSVQESTSSAAFNVMSGAFVAPNHTWITIEPNGLVSAGMDDFAQRLIGQVDEVIFPKENAIIKKGDPLATLKAGDEYVPIASPITGKVILVNFSLGKNPMLLSANPYQSGWFCKMEASSLPEELASLRIGADAVAWYQREVDRYYLSESRNGTAASSPVDSAKLRRIYQSFISE